MLFSRGKRSCTGATKGGEIKRTDTQHIVADSRNYLHAAFTFSDDDWTGIKTAVFKNGDVVKHAVLDDNNECLVPWEVIKSGILHVSVFCGDLITADTATVYINDSGYEDGGIPEDPSPTVYEQIIAMLNEIETGGIPDDKIAEVVEKYLSEHPVETITEEDVQRIVSEYVEAHKEELKGDKGDKGDTGAPGADGKDGADGAAGADGYTPVRGTDYWTADDIAEIQSYIDKQIGGGLDGSY